MLLEIFLLWITYWARLADGLVGVLSFTLIKPYWSLKAESWYLDVAEKRRVIKM